MEAKLTISGDKGKLELSGELTIAAAEEFRQHLLDTKAKVSSLELDLAKATAMDLSTLQVLCSAHRSFVLHDKEFDVIGNNEMLCTLFTRAGFHKNICRLNADVECLWCKGEGK